MKYLKIFNLAIYHNYMAIDLSTQESDIVLRFENRKEEAQGIEKKFYLQLASSLNMLNQAAIY